MNQEVFDKAFAVAEELERSGLPKGVQAVTVGYKRTNDTTTDRPALVFLVREKRSLEQVHPSMLIPSEIDGFTTDVVEMNPEPHDGAPGPYNRVEPLVGGLSIKADRIGGTGTLGAIFCNRTTRRPMGLTNRHVVDNWLINANGQAVFQPQEAQENLIGFVWRHNKAWDCAAIQLDANARKIARDSSFLRCEGRIRAFGRALVGMPVFKIGARTGRTVAVVRSSGPSAVEIRPQSSGEGLISDRGDSGSVWCHEGPEGHTAVALHWGGTRDGASAKPLIEVARLLELDILDSSD